jgi:hypothetical protein
MNKNITKILLIIGMVAALIILKAVSSYEQKEYVPEYLQEEVDFDVNNPEEKADYIKSLENGPVIILDDNLLEAEE